MSEYLIQGETLTGIADAIRGKTGGESPIPVSDMVAQIEGIQAGGGDIDALIDRSITEIESNVTNIGQHAFYNCSQLTTADFPMVTTIGDSAFYNCSQLTTADFPMVTSMGNSAFAGCFKLITINFPMLTGISSNTFYNSKLTTADLPMLTNIGGSAFTSCRELTSLILRNTNTVCTLANTNAFNLTNISKGTGYIYVPAALIEDYKVATNWSTFAAQFRALEDYTADGTTTGELDPAKTGT